jgi:ATP-dependent Clp protease ATP-binding subunit ClpX
MIPEFVGRFPSVVALEKLEKPDLVAILTRVKNNLVEQYQWLFHKDGIDLKITNDGIEVLVQRAMDSGTGARALHSEIERALLPHMFYLRDYLTRGIKYVEIGADLINNPTNL